MSIKKAINVDAAQGKRQNTNIKLWGNLGCGVAESASLCSLLSHSPSLLGWEHPSRWLSVLTLRVPWLSLYMSSFCPSSRSCCCQPSLGQCKRYALDVLFNQSSNTRCWAELEKCSYSIWDGMLIYLYCVDILIELRGNVRSIISALSNVCCSLK